MSGKYKRSFGEFPAWRYMEEIEHLNAASDKGWQLVKCGSFRRKFVKNTDIRYRYQIDYRKVEDMGRYIETFREQGWEYVNSSHKWHIFRKLYDPSLPDEEYEIFTDRQSLNEMNNRWARGTIITAAILGVCALIFAVWMLKTPMLPTFLQLLLLIIVSVFLLRGAVIMRNPQSRRGKRGGRTIFAVFCAFVVLGSCASTALTELRPYISGNIRTDSTTEPIIDNRWVDFDIRYADNYYLDLTFDSDAPMTFEIIDENDKAVYSVTDTSFSEDNIRLKLSRGRYQLSMTVDTGFNLDYALD